MSDAENNPDAQFANLYISRIIDEVIELTKIKLMNETRILFLEKQIIELGNKVELLGAHQAEKKKPKLREVRGDIEEGFIS